MLDVAKQDAGQCQDTKANVSLDDLSKKMNSCKVNDLEERSSRQPHEDEDTSDVKELNDIIAISENINKLNIVAGEDDDQDDELTEKGPTGGIPVAQDDWTERGPTGGVPVQPGLMANKSFPVGPMFNYIPQQMPYQNQVPMKGNRRNLDDGEIQPNKFFRPPADHDFKIQLQPGFQFSNPEGFTGCFTGTNNLSQGMPQQGVMNNQHFGTNIKPNYGYDMDPNNMTTTTKILSSTKMSGGTVSSPVSLGPQVSNSIVDDLLDGIDGRPLNTPQGNLPNFSNAGQFTNNFDDTMFNTKSFTEIRRQSDPDSGLDSDTGSPWSEQAPSPSSTYTSPPSVDSGCGQSPMHESQGYHGTSPPKYPGVTSPGGYRATPSPASTSGYGSPGQSQLDFELLDDINDFIAEDIKKDDLKRNRVRPQIAPPMMKNNLNGPPMMNQNLPMPPTTMVPNQPVMMAPAQMQPLPGQMLPPQPVSYPVTTANVSQPQQIIILQPQPQPTQPLFILPVKQSPQPQRTKFVKILPKVPQSSMASTTGSMTTTSGSKTGVSVTPSRNNNRSNTQSSTQAAQQSRLFVIASRTVAEIQKDDLMKSDDEGDTYLHIAVCKTDKHMVKALLVRLQREHLESLVDKENHKRQTPLYLAVFINQPVMVAMFVQFGANVNCQAQNFSSDGRTIEVKSAIHIAAAHGVEYQKTLVELLKAKDININIVNNNGQTALHCAILAHGKPVRNGTDRINSTEIIRTLIKHGADPSAQDMKSGKTPLMYAIEKKSIELVDTILTSVPVDKVKNVVKTQAFDGSSCLKIAESLKGSMEINIWNRLWNSLQSALTGSVSRIQIHP